MRFGTYSIVAHDPETGELGAAVQSHWFSVGSIVPWVRGGVGAVVTQSLAEAAYGPRLLERLGEGEDPEAALAAELAEDQLARFRQVAVVDGGGRVAVHTGASSIPEHGHVTGEGFSCQANIMVSPGIPEAMASAFTASVDRGLTERLLLALEAGQAAGGDVRGQQSAALLVALPDAEPWRRAIDLRVEDHPVPLVELERLIRLHAAYALSEQAEALAGYGDHATAAARWNEAVALQPDNDEILLWAGMGAAAAGDLDAGLEQVRRAIAINPGQGVVLERLTDELVPGVEEVRRRL